MGAYGDNSQSIGKTPLVSFSVVAGPEATVFAKIEGRNPAYSVKSRGAAMILDAEAGSGRAWKSMSQLRQAGISLAFVAAARGYKLLLTMPETMSIERRKVLKEISGRGSS